MKTLLKMKGFLVSMLSFLLVSQGFMNLAAGDLTLSPTITFNGEEAREGILEEAFNKPMLNRFHTIVPDIVAKKQIAFLDRFNKVTLADAGCGTGKSEKAIAMHEKFWDPVPTKMWLTPCWADFVGQFFVYSLKKGIKREDLTSTDLAMYLMDIMADATYDDVLRMAWFSDTAVDDYGSGGKLLAAADIPHYDQYDGFFKQIIAGVAIGAGTWGHIPNYAITANASASFALQDSDLAAGDTLTIWRNLITGADRRLLQHPERVIVCTQSLFDNWCDYKESKVLESSFKNEDTQQWEGIYRSTPIIPFPLWDQYIRADFNNTTVYDKPHRAILTTKQNLQIGFDGAQEFSKFEAFRDKSTDLYHIKGGYKVDAKLIQNYLISVAGF